ncbi:hypothetical protein C8J57DRAFT_1254978 [Mycena rebaudengoi]|nr:hypothetical protein C8J57DRAFT_1254978 [Mycena rebaudengoi]
MVPGDMKLDVLGTLRDKIHAVSGDIHLRECCTQNDRSAPGTHGATHRILLIPTIHTHADSLPPTPEPDALDIRTTRSGRVFAAWAPILAPFYSITTSVRKAVFRQADEDLTEPDTGPPLIAPPPTVSSTTNAPLVALSMPTSRKSREKIKSKERRNAQRKAQAVQAQLELRPPARRPHHVLNSPGPITVQVNFQMRKQRVASTGWIGLRDNGIADEEQRTGFIPSGPTPTHQLDDFFSDNPKFSGFKYVKYVDHRSRPLVDQDGKVFGVSAGHPDDPNWMANIHKPAVDAMKEATAKCSISEEWAFHRRGNFCSLTGGDSHGGGQERPGALVNGVINAAILVSLMSVFANWAPDIFDYYVVHMHLFYQRYKHLSRPFLNGIFCACTFNLGPYTCALGHRNFANLAFGWCAITALGYFDYMKGGHLILWDCKLILEFPLAQRFSFPVQPYSTPTYPLQMESCAFLSLNTPQGAYFDGFSMGFKMKKATSHLCRRRDVKGRKRRGLSELFAISHFFTAYTAENVPFTARFMGQKGTPMTNFGTTLGQVGDYRAYRGDILQQPLIGLPD